MNFGSLNSRFPRRRDGLAWRDGWGLGRHMLHFLGSQALGGNGVGSDGVVADSRRGTLFPSSPGPPFLCVSTEGAGVQGFTTSLHGAVRILVARGAVGTACQFGPYWDPRTPVCGAARRHARLSCWSY